jgi:hypothetical protein
MTIQTISSPGHGDHNEDLIAVFQKEGLTDIIMMDGASSVADEDFIDRDAGDVAWFVRQFAASLAQTISASRSQEDSVRLALGQLRSEFHARTRGVTVPLYAWPIAAMTWVRIWEEGDSVTLEAYCLGDCKTMLRLPDHSVLDLDPYVNPQEGIVQGEVARLAQEGVDDPSTRRERLLPMLRARREFQNTTDAPIALVLQPNGPLQARTRTVQADPGAMLLMMTDGFYRLVDMYDLYTDEQLADACATRGLDALIQELREVESAGAATVSVKSSDDATAVTWRKGSR